MKLTGGAGLSVGQAKRGCVVGLTRGTPVSVVHERARRGVGLSGGGRAGHARELDLAPVGGPVWERGKESGPAVGEGLGCRGEEVGRGERAGPLCARRAKRGVGLGW